MKFLRFFLVTLLCTSLALTACKVPEPTEPLVGAGSSTTVGDLTWTLSEATDKGNTLYGIENVLSSAFYQATDKTTTGTYIWVSINLENQGNKPNSALGGFKLLDAQGRTFEPEIDLLQWIPTDQRNYVESLNPGESAIYTRIYDIPTDATELRVLTHNGTLFSPKTVPIFLGL